MKTIGFIDYYLSEFHANNYPAWIKEVSKKSGEDFVVKFAWGEIPSKVDGKSNEQWCEEHEIELCASIEEVCQKADYLIVLAPSNPEKHLEYAQRVLAFGKRTYIDKTFAPDHATAEAIYALGEKYGTPFFSSSALRYATELEEFVGSTDMITTGGGRNIEEYCIHQIEMIVKVLQATPTRLKVSQQAQGQYTVSIQFDEGKNATIVFATAMPFTFCVNTSEGKSSYRQISSEFFVLLIEKILQFFKDGVLPFDKKETLTVMKIREKLVEGLNHLDSWLEL